VSRRGPNDLRLASFNALLPCGAWLVAIVLFTSLAVAQQGQNIAGTYRGLMTGCLSQARSADCRKGFTEIIALADSVDARRIAWERATAASDTSAARLHEDYALALTRLNRAVDDFNRNMTSAAQSK
jgi:hypothetical protein